MKNTVMKIRGRVWKFGDHVNTDDIIPAAYLHTIDPGKLGKHLMEHLRPGFSGEVKPGDIIVAWHNFGCGSSREHAALALKGCGIAAVVAVSFARIFYRNAFNMGLPIFECKKAAMNIEEGDEVEIDAASGQIQDLTNGEIYQAEAVSPFMRELIRSGGLIDYVVSRRK